MKNMRLASLIAIAAVAIPSIAAGPDRQSKQRAEQVKALEKKQRVREQIRERRKTQKGKK